MDSALVLFNSSQIIRVVVYKYICALTMAPNATERKLFVWENI